MDEMKPCPFCGRRGRIKKYSDDRYRAVCENHLCPVESFDYHTAKEAQDWWNKRHDPEHDRWISVEERLPEESGFTIIFCMENGLRHVTFARFQKRFKRWDLTGARSYWRVTHWKPLPEPPKEET